MASLQRVPPPFPVAQQGEDASRAIIVWRDPSAPLPPSNGAQDIEGPRIEILDDDEDLANVETSQGLVNHGFFPGADDPEEEWAMSDGECKPMEFD